MPMTAEHRTSDGIPWPQIYGQYLDQCRSVHDTIKARPQLRPDLVVAHGGRVRRRCSSARCSTARSSSIANIISRTAIATSRTGSTCRRPSRPRSSRAASTRRPWRPWSTATPATRRPTGRSSRSRSGSTPRSRSISTGSRPSSTAPARRRGRSAKRSIPAGTRVVTFVSRGLESIRGFDLFMKVADRIARARSDVVFVVVGGEEIHYGWDKLHTGLAELQAVGLEPGELRPDPVHLPGPDLARATGRHPPDQRPAHLPDGPVRAVVVAAGRDGERLRGAGLGRAAGARGDRARARTAWSSRSSTSNRLTETALRGARRSGRIRPPGPRRPADDRGKLQPGGLHPAAQGLLRASRLDGTLRTAGRAAMVRGSARDVPDSAGIRRSRRADGDSGRRGIPPSPPVRRPRG